MQFLGLKQGGKMQEDYNFISNLSKIQLNELHNSTFYTCIRKK